MIRPALKSTALPDHGRAGASLPTVIMVVALMMSLAFTVVAIAFNHLNLSFRSTNNAKAQHLAEATLALAIEKAANDIENYGVVGSSAEKTIELSFASYGAGNRGVLSFHPDTAESLGVPYSTNNRSESAVAGSNPQQQVPGQSLHLVARAEVGGAFSTMEAIVELPKFPYSIASGGAIRSDGGLLVASVRPGADYDLSLPIHEQDLQPGHLVSNSKSGSDAIVMKGTNKILGDVQSASGATLDAETEVRGEMRLDADQIQLPTLHASGYDPRQSRHEDNTPDGPEDGFIPRESDIQYVNSGGGSLTVKGYNVSERSLTVDTGVKLNGGVLFVDGDLTVSSGGVRGKGAIIATGNITILGGGEATTDNEAALIADGNITLSGRSYDKAKFAGLIYTNGNLSAENMRLAGVFVAAGGAAPGGAGDVTLKDTELYHVDELAKLAVSDAFVVPDVLNTNTSTYSDGDNGISFSLPISYDPSKLQQNLQQYENTKRSPGDPSHLFVFRSGEKYVTVKAVNGKNQMVEVSNFDEKHVVDGGDLGMVFCGKPVKSGAEAEAAALTKARAEYQAAGKAMSATNEKTIASLARAAFDSSAAGYQLGVAAIEHSMGLVGGDDGGELTQVKWSIDLSEFVNSSERMQVRYWARYR